MGAAIHLQRVLAALGLGACGALLFAWALRIAAGEPVAPGSVAVWVCDRDAGRVWGLDGAGFLAREERLAFPLELAPAPGGARYLLQALRPGPDGPCRLLRLGVTGGSTGELELESARGLVVDREGTAFALVGGPERPRLIGWTAGGELLSLGEWPGGRTLRLGSARLWVLGEREAWPIARTPSEAQSTLASSVGWPAERLLDAVFDVGGSWWLTEGAQRLHLRRLGAASAVILELEAPERTARLVPDGKGGVWCLGHDGSWRRIDAEGRRGALRIGLQRPQRSACTDGAGGFWAVSPGAVQRVDGTGRLRLAQGGFDVLVDVDQASP